MLFLYLKNFLMNIHCNLPSAIFSLVVSDIELTFWVALSATLASVVFSLGGDIVGGKGTCCGCEIAIFCCAPDCICCNCVGLAVTCGIVVGCVGVAWIWLIIVPGAAICCSCRRKQTNCFCLTRSGVVNILWYLISDKVYPDKCFAVLAILLFFLVIGISNITLEFDGNTTVVTIIIYYLYLNYVTLR